MKCEAKQDIILVFHPPGVLMFLGIYEAAHKTSKISLQLCGKMWIDPQNFALSSFFMDIGLRDGMQKILK